MPLPSTAMIDEKDVVLYAYRGSHAHGTYIPSSDPNSIDDIDTMGVFFYPLSYYLGVPGTEFKQTIEVKQGEWDVVYYEIRKFIRLLMNNNPNVLMMLFLRESDYLRMDWPGREIIENKHLFASRLAAETFVGYAKDQLKKMTAFQMNLGYMGEKRKRLVEKFGYDTKNAAHCVRLLRMGYEFLKTGEMAVYRPDAEELMDIKTGKWPLEKVKSEVENRIVDFESVLDKSPLQERPDIPAINELLVSIMKRHFSLD